MESETLKIYLTIPKFSLDDIMIHGITPGINDGTLCKHPFLICNREKPRVYTGHAAYLEIEVEADDPRLIHINKGQSEYHDYVPTSQITAIAYPPTENWEVIEQYERYGKDFKNPEYRKNWEFIETTFACRLYMSEA